MHGRCTMYMYTVLYALIYCPPAQSMHTMIYCTCTHARETMHTRHVNVTSLVASGAVPMNILCGAVLCCAANSIPFNSIQCAKFNWIYSTLLFAFLLTHYSKWLCSAANTFRSASLFACNYIRRLWSRVEWIQIRY